MSSIIQVSRLSKAYRLGKKAERAESLMGLLRDAVTAPLRNWRSMQHPTGGDSEPIEELHWALRDVSFEVQEGEVLGVIGRNGAGKSTLLKILSRITEPSGGEVRISGRVASLLEVGTGFHPELTGRENVYLNGTILGMHKREIDRKFEEIVEFSGVEKFLDTPIKRYSSGMKVRLAFSVAAHLEPEILVVDEVLAVGDSEFQAKCAKKMRTFSSGGRTVLFVSHNNGAIRELCNKCLYLNHGQVESLGEVDTILARYNSNGKSDVFCTNNGPIRRVEVTQKDTQIEILAEWNYPLGVRLPNIGFVISDPMGGPVVGFNPVIANYAPDVRLTTSGTVTAILSEPKLLDGKYSLSVYFGNENEDFASYLNCLLFDVCGMAGMRQHHSPHVVGFVAPTCKFLFAGNSNG